jgi:PST family polysaccharide transporter
MSLIRTSLLNGIAVVVRMATGILLNKVLAVYVGPGGYAAIGQLQNVISIVTTFASGAVNTGVTKFTAEYFDAPERRKTLWRTAGTITLLGAAMSSVVLWLSSESLGRRFFPGAGYGESLNWLAACLVLISLNAFLLAILSGMKEVRRYVFANIASSVIGFFVSLLLTWQLGLRGALIALSLGQAVAFAATLFFCRGLYWCKLDMLVGAINAGTTAQLTRFVAMAVTSATVIPVSQMLIRAHLVATFGADHAGYWDAMNKVSGIYLALITTTLSLYYLPRISEIRDDVTLRAEIWAGFRLIAPVTAVLALAIYALRAPLVHLLFSAQFHEMTNLMAWQLTGDVIKVISWLLGYVLVGRAMMVPYVITEIVFSVSLYGVTLLATDRLGFPGVAAAYALNYALYLCVMYWIVMVRRLPGVTR